MKILVADDDPMMLKTIAIRLKRDGHDVFLAENGQEALDMVATLSPDLVVTDIMMPYASGLEIIGFIRENKEKKVPIIILSAMGQEDVVLEAFHLGADDYITKPFSPDELSVRVKRLMSR